MFLLLSFVTTVEKPRAEAVVDAPARIADISRNVKVFFISQKVYLNFCNIVKRIIYLIYLSIL